MFVANGAPARDSALCVDNPPVQRGVHHEYLVNVRFLIVDEFGLIDPPTNDELVDEITLKSTEASSWLYFVLVHFIFDKFTLFGV